MQLLFLVFVFFSSRRRHTRYWRDWSSDVCSSDLALGVAAAGGWREPGRPWLGTWLFSPEFRREQPGRVRDLLEHFARHRATRSEERRVGKEWRSRWSTYH